MLFFFSCPKDHPKISFIGQKVWPVARARTHTHTDGKTDGQTQIDKVKVQDFCCGHFRCPTYSGLCGCVSRIYHSCTHRDVNIGTYLTCCNKHDLSPADLQKTRFVARRFVIAPVLDQGWDLKWVECPNFDLRWRWHVILDPRLDRGQVESQPEAMGLRR